MPLDLAHCCILIFSKLFDAVSELKGSTYESNVFCTLVDSLKLLGASGIDEILCYGLGQFSKFRSPKHQLALLLSLKSRYCCHTSVYDPAFSQQEIEILQKLGLSVLQSNEEGKHRLDNSKMTLIYMPHCPQPLMNNFLYANWGRGLSNCILFSNSFSSVVRGYLFNRISRNIKYVLRIDPYVTEFDLDNDFKNTNAFNNINIHVFTGDKLDSTPSDFWELKEEPFYGKKECELIVKTETNN